MERKTEREIDRERAEEQREEEEREEKVKKAERARKSREKNERTAERESVSEKQLLAPGPANSSCHSNVLPTTQFNSSVVVCCRFTLLTHTYTDVQTQRLALNGAGSPKFEPKISKAKLNVKASEALTRKMEGGRCKVPPSIPPCSGFRKWVKQKLYYLT